MKMHLKSIKLDAIELKELLGINRAVFTWLSKGIGFGFTTPFGWLVYLLWFWFYDSQVKTALTGIGKQWLNSHVFQIQYNLHIVPANRNRENTLKFIIQYYLLMISWNNIFNQIYKLARGER